LNNKNALKRLFFSVLLVFSGFSLFAQETAPLPASIPSPEDMRKAGASEGQIKQAMDFLQGANKGQSSSSGSPLGQSSNTQNTQNAQNSQNTQQKLMDVGNKSGQTDNTKQEPSKDSKPNEPVKDDQAKTEFDKDGKLDVRERLVYGKQLFRNGSISFFDHSGNSVAPENYVIGSNDELAVNVWGYTDFSDNYKVNEMGYASGKLIGRVYLSGLTFAQAKAIIKSKLSQVMDLQNSSSDITLSSSRVVSVNIVGEVVHPGTYEIPAINTVFNALVAAGGPNAIGSVRNIYLKRAGKVIDSLDVYKFLFDPAYFKDVFLQNNDYIYVPSVKRIVTIKGEVRRDGVYELKGNENMNALLHFVGGLNTTAYVKNIQFKRIRNNAEVLLDLNLDSVLRAKKDFILNDEDEITINRVPQGVGNMVTLMGSLKLPGDYELKKGEKLSEMLKKAEGPVFDAYLQKAYIIRIKDDLTKEFIPVNLESVLKNPASPDNIVMHEFDVVRVLSKTAFADTFPVTIAGMVRMPGTYNLGSGLTIKDALALVGGVKQDAYLERAFLVREEKVIHLKK